ncbi:putative esterase C31F10.02 isoform X2 [Chenopodium quinoa]|uniref:putative esterase C31F10.02 isoform X2 n=1 Tax=Chenopodium quinoa TaxID=63459 RepID=UPI000B792725|nr:putative esterase C31F10.02 isoform X2 [Chenopodium quinoa]
MEFETIKNYLEKPGKKDEPTEIHKLPLRFFDAFIVHGLRIDQIEHGRVLCSFNVPQRLLNTANTLHGGAIASLVDLVGSAVVFTVGAPSTGVSVEINVSYLDAALPDVLRVMWLLLCYPDIERKRLYGCRFEGRD